VVTPLLQKVWMPPHSSVGLQIVTAAISNDHVWANHSATVASSGKIQKHILHLSPLHLSPSEM